MCEQRIPESLTEVFWEFYLVIWGGGVTEPKLFWNEFGNLFVCNGTWGGKLFYLQLERIFASC